MELSMRIKKKKEKKKTFIKRLDDEYFKPFFIHDYENRKD